MLSRRDFLAVAAATAAVTGLGDRLAAAAARQRLSQQDLLTFSPKGQVTILHMTDCHAQLVPAYYREPSVNLGVGDAAGKPPHVTGSDFLKLFDIAPGSARAYALTSEDFAALAKDYGRVGGMDRMATLVEAIRAERGADRTLFLDGGDSLQGSYTALQSKGADMVKVLNRLGVEATTGHWEFTYGADRVLEFAGDKESRGELEAAFLAGNVFDTEWDEPVFNSSKMFEKGGVKIAVIGQAFPFTPIANPRWMIPAWSFGIRERVVRERVAAARKAGAELVVLLSHNGFDVDRKLASRVEGIDVILTGHTHDALPVPVKVNGTLLIATGSSTKFLSRLDVEVKNGRLTDYEYALIPVLADAITPDPDMAKLVAEIRAPHKAKLETVLGRTETLLYRRGNFNGTFDDLICNAMLEERDAEIALSPGFRWGPSLLPGQDITWDDVYSETGMTYPACYRLDMTGEMLKAILEDVADNLFNHDPYYQQGGDMVRVGGMGYAIAVNAAMGQRISDMTLLKNGEPIEPERVYKVAGWASVNQNTEGPPIWDVVGAYLKRKGTVRVAPNSAIKVAAT
ncbi:MAG: thiosulfohydrolase SoxB [Hyphomicrobiales bacterium]|nr:thiosulfohydrolase SoxB [Hyphomicrobiales bacterium]